VDLDVKSKRSADLRHAHLPKGRMGDCMPSSNELYSTDRVLKLLSSSVASSRYPVLRLPDIH
jgi:hypothetical protein